MTLPWGRATGLPTWLSRTCGTTLTRSLRERCRARPKQREQSAAEATLARLTTTRLTGLTTWRPTGLTARLTRRTTWRSATRTSRQEASSIADRRATWARSATRATRNTRCTGEEEA